MNRLLSMVLVCLLQVSLALASTFNLKVEATPDGSGSLNTSGGTYEEGSSIYLRAYNNTGFVFKGWYEGEKLLSSSTGFTYTMPAHDAVVQARYEYDPSVPENPAMPDTTTHYSLSLSVSPVGAGSLNIEGGKYAAGESVYLRAYANTGFQFVQWQDEKGEKVSTTSSFYYKMPSNDAKLTAIYTYDPSVPANPDSMATRYTVTLSCKPEGSGSFNTSSATEEEGSSVHLYAYTNNGFKFLHWEDANGNIIASEQSFYYVMPHGNSQIYGVFEYDPSNPSNPGKNSFDSFTGEVIVDDFTPGDLSSEISAVTNGNTSKITMITVAGKMNSNDFSIVNNYSNCTRVDLSRTSGINTIPSYCYNGNTHINSIYLPACISFIEYRAFYNASSLTELTCYATVPPTLGSQVFTGVADGMTVYVPASSIELYENADGWKDYVADGTIVIMPIRDQVSSLEVNLPTECSDGRYKNMPLELVNVKSGQKYKYVVTDRINYIFNNLVHGTEYIATLKNLSDAVLAKSETIAIVDKDVSYDFVLANMKQLRTVNASVVTSSGEDVTSQTTINWYDESGTFLSQGTDISGQVSESKLKCSVTLPQTLGMQYVLPTDSVYEVVEGENALVYTLTTLPTLSVKGNVIDKTTRQAISGASVTVSQTLNNKYSKSLTAKTDSKGDYTLQAFVAPSTVTFSADDYISQTVTLTDSMLKKAAVVAGAEPVKVDTVKLKPISGATITTNFTYTASVAANVEPETQNHYSNYNNVAYTIYNETAKKVISQFNVQYPSIVLLEEVDENDSLTITAKSKNSAFKDIVVGGRIDQSNHMSVTIPVVQWGGIEATFTQTENSSVLGILYDADGKFVNKYTYGSSTLSISDLKDGEYTLVTMGESAFFSSVYDISNFKDAGLQQDIDYVVNKVSVSSGVITSVKNVLIPFFDESKFYYTGDNTSFTVNKTSVIAGNYLTLTAKVDFKDVYKKNVKDKNIVVELPEGTTFVDNSVMVGSAIAYYELKGNTLVIPLEDTPLSDRVRFCIVPTQSGSYAPNAAIAFKLNGKSVSQPIGSANYTVKDLSIKVPESISKKEFSVSGTATARSTIRVFDNTTLIGETKALANGFWSTTVKLDNAYNLSSHNIFAKIVTKDGAELQTPTKDLIYDENCIEISKVKMYHWNPETNKNYELLFDFQNPSNRPGSYVYYIYNKKFTFTIDFTNNDTTKVKDVVLYVRTGKGRKIPLDANYSAKQGLWVAEGEFGNLYDGDIPVNVSVSYLINSAIAQIDYAQVLDVYNQQSDTETEFETIDEIESLSLKNLESGNNSQSSVDDIITNLRDELDLPDNNAEFDAKYSEYKKLSDEQRKTVRDSLLNEVKNIDYLAGVKFYDEKQQLLDSLFYTFNIGDSTYTFRKSTCDGLTPEILISEGYRQISSSNGDSLFIKNEESQVDFVDLKSNIHLIITSANPTAHQSKASLKNMWETALRQLDKCNDDLVKAQTIALDAIEAISEFFNEKIGKLTESAERLRAMARLDREMGLVEGSGELLDNAKSLEAEAIKLEARAGKYKQFAASAKASGKLIVGKAVQLLGSIASLYNDVKKWLALYNKIDSKIPCKNNESYAEQLRSDVTYYGSLICTGDVITFVGACFAVYSAAMGLAGTPLTGGLSTAIGGGLGLAGAGVSILAGVAFDFLSNHYYKKLKKQVDKLKCGKKDDDDNNNDDDQESGNDDAENTIDPSGYVYEGVSSNRLQGVTATCYYKETVEDMYGDLHENVVLWNAEEYAQKNPLFTDENGMYQWDVPEGLWQVKYEKEGYVTTYSEWLPVPPPQLDVNIGMVQNAQPEVIRAKAYEDGVEVEFSKYMNIESLNNNNLYVKVVKGSEESLIKDAKIELLNKEAAIEGSETSYASKVKLATDTLGYFDEAYVIVSTGVKSYAGISMAQTFEQKLDVEKKVRTLLVDSVFNVAYNDSVEITIAATPAEAAVSKTLSIKSASDMIAKTNVSQATFDADGQIKLKVSGELLGSTALQYSLDDADLTATSLVNVVAPSKLAAVIAPVASRISGTAVYRGQTVSLSCESEGATIYYTTDGSCPCDNATRIKYERPIAINDAMTLKIMAIGTNFDESEIRTYSYTIRQSDVKLNLAKGWNWSSHDMASPLNISELTGIASRVLTQTDEAIDDPVSGFIGSLTSIDGTQAMKIETKKDTTKAFTGEQYNPSLTSITLHEGWNWLGYPVSQTMTLTDAFSYLDVDEGDCIANLDNGFATYTNGTWRGTLQTLTPGSGYLYKSGSAKSFIYNTVPTVSNAKALYGHRLATSEAPWSVNKHSYPDMMPVIAQICYSDGSPADSTYYVGVFAGNECRGVGEYSGDVMYLSAYGDNSVDLSFKVYNKENGSMYDISEGLKFKDDVVGSNSNPYRLVLDFDPTGISNVLCNGSNVKGIYNINGVKLNSITTRGIYIIHSTDANGHSVMQKQYVK